MSLNSYDKNQSQYDRKLARQKQLDMMEAAAAGQNTPSNPASSPATSIHSQNSQQQQQQQPPVGTFENARRFLWDDDDDDYGKGEVGFTTTQGTHDNTHMNLMGHNNAGHVSGAAAGGGFTGRIAALVGSLPRFKARTGMEEQEPVNLAPRSQSMWMVHGDAQTRSSESEEYMNQPKSRGIVGTICDAFLAVFHTIVGVCAILVECITGCLSGINPKLVASLCAGSIGLGLFIFAIVAIVHRTTGSSSAAAAVARPLIEDEVRYHSIRNSILESTFTAQQHLDAVGTAQNLALRWLTDFDPANLATDHGALLQRYALAVFYFSTYLNAELHDQQNHGAKEGGWVNMEFWMTEKGICDWYGVSCPPHLHEGAEVVHYNENSDVLQLNLTDNNVAGTIPSELVALENLQSLDLGKNGMTGTIPKSLMLLRLMNEIYLEENNFSGTIPTEVGSLVAMKDMFLGTNKFTGTIPAELGTLTQLRALGLDENFFTGTIPNLWKCTQLLILYLDNNQLKGPIPFDVKNLKELIDLRLRKNQLTGSIPEEIKNLVHLELLYVDDNQLTGTVPEIWDLMPRIQEIQIYRNKIGGALPESFSTLKDLRVLYADNNALVGTLPTSYGVLNDLQIYYVFNNQLNGKIPTEYGEMENLRDFQIFSNKLTGKIPTELGKCYKLTKFEAQDNSLTGTVPNEFGQLETLESLKIFRNLLSGSIPSSICTLKTKFDLNFLAADCNTEAQGTIGCKCCSACYP